MSKKNQDFLKTKKLITEVFVDQCASFLEATFMLMEYFNDDDKFAKDVAELKQTEAAPLRFEEGIRC